MRLLIFLAIVALFCVSNSSYCQGKYDRQADCKLQCQDAYDMAVTDCKAAYDGPYDTKQRQKCIDKGREPGTSHASKNVRDCMMLSSRPLLCFP
jgi:hypothetical protein